MVVLMTMHPAEASLPSTWWWQLSGDVSINHPDKAYDIDLFDNTPDKIASLKNSGKIVICYFSAGSYEAWRPDANNIPKADRGRKMNGWDEQWVNVRSKAVRDVMAKRMDLAKSKGCIGVEPDNVDGYADGNITGFKTGVADSRDFLTFLSTAAHARGLIIGLKNSPEMVDKFVDKFDFSVVEQCFQYDECDQFLPFVKAGKPIYEAEYKDKIDQTICAKAKSMGISTYFFPASLSLNGENVRVCK